LALRDGFDSEILHAVTVSARDRKKGREEFVDRRAGNKKLVVGPPITRLGDQSRRVACQLGRARL
jgi:hypothetical protein